MRNRLIYILILSLLAVACSKEQLTPSHNDEENNYLNITTRTSDTDNDFAEGSTLRFAIYDSGKPTIHLVENLNYVYAEMSSSGWLYSYDGGVTTNKAFGFLKNKTEEIDIVGVYPYIEDEDLSQVAFSTLETQKPFMWANSKKISLNCDSIGVKLDFKHIMSALYFDMKLKNSADNVIISYINVSLLSKSVNSKAELPVNATIDFTNNGEIIVDEKSHTLQFLLNKNFTLAPGSDGVYELKHHIFLPPFDMEADDMLEISFVINGVKPTVNNAIRITGAELGNGIEMGMVEGMRYTLPIEIDNYLKFSGTITKETKWSDAETIYVEF